MLVARPMNDTVLLPLPVLLLGVALWLGGLAFSRWRPVCRRWPALGGEWAALGLLAALNLGFFWRVLLTRDTWLPRGGGDLNSFYYPLYRFAAERIGANDFPLWNPHLWAGAPFAANQQAGLFSPFNLAAFLLARPFSYGTLEWLIIGQVWLASALAYTFCRDLGCRRAAALIGGVGFAYSAFLVAHLGHYPMVAVAPWLPAALLATRRGVAGGGLRPILAGAGALLLAVLGGHQQIFLYLLTAVALYWLYLTWRASPAPFWPPGPGHVARWLGKPFAAHWLRSGGTFGLTLGLALGLAAPALLPSLELARRSIRAAISYEESTAFALRPLHLVTLLVPNAFGSTPGTYISAVGFSGEVWGYAGVAALGLAALAFARPGRPVTAAATAGDGAGVAAVAARGAGAGFFAGVALLSLLLALGPATPLGGWLYAFAPGFDRIRAAGRWFFLFDFAVATLAALGAENLLRLLGGAAGEAAPEGEPGAAVRGLLRRIALGLAVALGVGTVALLIAYGALLAPRDPSGPLVQFLDSAASFLLILGLALVLVVALARGGLRGRGAATALVALVVLDLFAATAAVPPGNDDPLADFRHDEALARIQAARGGATEPFRIDQSRLGAGWQPSWALVAGLDGVSGAYDPQGLARYNRYWDVAGRRPDSARYDLLNVRYILTPPDQPLTGPAGKFREVARGRDYAIYENTGALPRAFLVGRAVPVADAEAAWSAVSANGFDPRAVVYLEGGAAPLDSGAAAGTVTLSRPGPDELTATVESDREAILVLGEVAYPGWRATIDGRDVPLLTADYTFRAVRVPAGRHEVRLVFDPPLWRLGWLVAAVTAATIVVLLATAAWRTRRHRASVAAVPA